MLQNNPPTIPQADLIAIDALFRRIAERGRKVRIQQSQENSLQKQNPSLPTEQAVVVNKATQGSK